VAVTESGCTAALGNRGSTLTVHSVEPVVDRLGGCHTPKFEFVKQILPPTLSSSRVGIVAL